MDSFVAAVICGGGGLRLWPLSRAAYAKPFVRLPGRDRPLLADTFARIAQSPDAPAAIIVIAAENDIPMCRRTAAEYAPKIPHLFVGEPEGRDTAPAIAAAACLSAKRFGGETPLLVLPADHAVARADNFWRAAIRAARAAADGKIALLGIPPDSPATGYGYIERGTMESESQFAVRRFVEKPDAARAAQFLADGNFLWNAGIFSFTPQTLFSELRSETPELFAPLDDLRKTIGGDSDSWSPPQKHYARLPKISFDYAVMEKTRRASVVAAENTGWSDVGSWRAVAETLPADADGNRNFAAAELLDCKNCFVAGGHRLIAAVGARDLHIVDTPDALLISAAADSEKVRDLAAHLRAQKRPQAETPATVRRPWGEYTVLSEGDGYKVKRISVSPGGKLSLQSHRRRSEHWTTVAGTMTVTIDEREFAQAAGAACFVPLGAKHRMANDTAAEAAIIEVQIGDYLGEDDIVRYEDIYGRR